MPSADAPAPPQPVRPRPHQVEDPEEFRMSIGDHLEELRWRLIFGLGGFAIALLICLWFSDRVIVAFCAPLIHELQRHQISPQLFYSGLSDPFMTYLKMSLISAAAIAGPWLLYQLWLFVAAGLYPRERKIITKYIPMSVGLLLSGFLFVYFLVLPLSIDFFLNFSTNIPLPLMALSNVDRNAVTATQPAALPVLAQDPAAPGNGAMWLDAATGRIKVFFAGHTAVIPFGPANLAAPIITLPDYIDLVITFMVTFGLCFQLPLVMVALVRVGILKIDWLKKKRRIIYFSLSIFAAVVAPGDVITSMLSLLLPLLVLFEFGILLARYGEKQREADESGLAT